MSKPTTIKEALKKWEEKNSDKKLAAATVVELQFQNPPIEKMDNSLSVLTECEMLSLSTNMIDKISGLNSLKNLKILSLGRNYIKSISGLEGVADTLQQLWISYNFIEKLKGIGILKQLKILYISHNLVKDWTEFQKLQELPNLEDLQFIGNPLHESLDQEAYRNEVSRRLFKLVKLDGETILKDDSTL